MLAGLGLALWVAGLGLAIWARLYIGRNWGMPMTRREHPDLVTTGPYRRVRHPIYTGIILGLLGTALATTPWGLIAVAVIGGFFVFSATREERFLAEEFPDSYPGLQGQGEDADPVPPVAGPDDRRRPSDKRDRMHFRPYMGEKYSQQPKTAPMSLITA